ncbi:hypothetical protein J2W34_001467 [Variovorax boronicumulans]|uniref:imm11 family protein n=1 Tax=Variovorax boronicumulans TaxID=436515 RepID=UPI0027801640|nr:DUF1629 domain-containing protein [Variovorax boronicumulans]MDQ0069693.1 hypothetical protein [Variovorax boronicumulans]
MTKLLAVDLRRSVPTPEASPKITPLLDEIDLNSGQSEAHRWKPIYVTLIDDRDSVPGLADLIVTVPFLMASSRLVELLRSFDCNCEYLPLITEYRGKQSEGEYFALNSLHVVRDAVDLGQSKIGRYLEKFALAREVDELVLKAGATGDAPLSYLHEVLSFAVSEQVATAIAKAGLVGVKLLNPEEFRS